MLLLYRCLIMNFDMRVDKRQCEIWDAEQQLQRRLVEKTSTIPIKITDSGCGYQLKFVLENIFAFYPMLPRLGLEIKIDKIPIIIQYDWERFPEEAAEEIYLTLRAPDGVTGRTRKIFKIIEDIIVNCNKYTPTLRLDESYNKYEILIQQGGRIKYKQEYY